MTRSQHTIASLSAFTALKIFLFLILSAGYGCGKRSASDDQERTITLQTDWFAQPEYAGFYQALATGLYAKRGLTVTLLEGGPNADPLKRLLTGRCDLINGRSDDAIVAYSRGFPVRFVGVTMQHNPHGILSHASHPITDFKQLDGKRVMVEIAAPWLDYIERKYGISIVRMPHNFGLSHYLNSETFIQQCFVTNEPYFAEKQGAKPVVLPIWESGFDGYRGLLAHTRVLEEKREAIRDFVEATHEGLHDYLYHDPEPAHALIAQRNPEMTRELMHYIRDAMIKYGIIDGSPNDPANIGKLERQRVESNIADLLELGIIENRVEPEQVFLFTQ
jgi:NitT/TauT family transport system substrate-binding protein